MKFTQRKMMIILGVLSIIFFFVYNFLNITVPGMYNSPDENVNSVFIQEFKNHNRLFLPHALDYGNLSEFIHPRSTYVIGERVVPVSFWGIPVIYGTVAKLVGSSFPFFTPLLAIVLIWCWFFIIKKIFDLPVAFFSSILLFVNPAFWYFTTRSLLPNIPYLSFVTVGFIFIFVRPLFRTKVDAWWVNDVLGFTFFACGFLIRPNEMVWVGLVMAIVLFNSQKLILLPRILLHGSLSAILLVVFFLVNQHIHQSFAGTYVSSGSLPVAHWYGVLLPFGFHPYQMLHSLYVFGFELLWWITVPMLLGLLYCLWKFKKGDKRRLYSWIVFGVALYVVTYYGSYSDPFYALHSIAVSYSRYWLPIYILGAPIIAYIFLHAFEEKIHNRTRMLVILCYILISVYFSSVTVFFGPSGFLATKLALTDAMDLRRDILLNIPSTAILVADYEDKYIWPDRAVMVRFRDPKVGMVIKAFLEKGQSVYYLSYTLTTVELIKTNEYLRIYGGVVSEVVVHSSTHSLYLIKNIEARI